MFVCEKIKALKYCSINQYAALLLPGLCESDYCLGSGVTQRPLFKQFKVYGT